MNNQTANVDFYLGALGPHGFQGYFDRLCQEQDRQMYLIKSGPGCGKSTMMRKIAEASPLPVQRIHCSSDPDSLDGVILEHPRAAVVDATPPHAVEPVCPGALERVVSLYHTMDVARLTENRGQILRLSMRCKALQERAASYIAGASKLLADSRATASWSTDTAKASAFAARLALRYLPRGESEGEEQVRLLSAVTPKGVLTFYSTVPALADTIVVFHDEYGLCSRLILEELRRQALRRGCSIISCPCPLGCGEIEHLFIPALRLAFLTSNSWHPMDFEGQKNIHCRRFEDKSKLHCRKKRLRFNRRAAAELLGQASAMQREAKLSHDAMEQLYGATIDFAAVDRAAEELRAELGM